MIVLDIAILMGASLAGLVLGGIFFGGLWLTIDRTLSSPALGMWLVGGFILRVAIALTGFYVVFAGHWQRLIACLIGFVLARFIIARALRDHSSEKTGTARKTSNAP